MWCSHNEKNSLEKSQFCESPVKLKSNNLPGGSATATSTTIPSSLKEKTDSIYCGSNISSKSSTSASPVVTEQDSFRVFSTPSKGECESGNRIPLTLPGDTSSSNSVRRSSTQSMPEHHNSAPLPDTRQSQPQGQSLINEGTYQQRPLQDVNQETSLSPSSSSSVLSYSNAYTSSTVVDYNNSASAYQPNQDNGKNPIANYLQKNKLKNRSVTGKFSLV